MMPYYRRYVFLGCYFEQWDSLHSISHSCRVWPSVTVWGSREATSAPQQSLRSVFIAISKKGNAKEYSNYRTTALISHASKVMLKILQARFQQYRNQELPDVQTGFRKGRGSRDQIANICWITKKAREFQKSIFFASLTMLKPLIVWITTNCGKLLKTWEYQTTLSASWETCMQDKKQQLEPDMEQWTGSKLGKEYDKAVYCHPAYLTYMQSTSCWAGWSTSWNQDCQEKYQQA